MDRAIQIIKRDIEIRESKMINKEYILRKNELKIEVESLEKALRLVTLGLPSVSKGEADSLPLPQNECVVCGVLIDPRLTACSTCTWAG